MGRTRHSRASKHARQGRERYGRRRVGARKPLPVMVVVCDDRVTAPRYFWELAALVKQWVHVKCVRAPYGGAAPDVLLNLARQELRNARDKGDSVWLCLDYEGPDQQKQRVRDVIEEAKGSNINTAVSAPCFDLWTLLHIEDTGRRFIRCADVIERIKKLWRREFKQEFGKKSCAEYERIVGRYREAAARARKHWDAQIPAGTQVFRIIEEIQRLAPSSRQNRGPD